MGSQQSCQVSVVANGENPSAYATRHHPDYPDKILMNPKEYPTMKELVLESFRKNSDRKYLGARKYLGDNKYAPNFEFKTYKECLEISTNFGSGLSKLQIGVGQMLGIYAPNCFEWVHAIDASCLYGFVIVSLYDSLGPDSLQYLVEHSKMTTILVSSKNVSKLMKLLLADKSFVENIILIGDEEYEETKREGAEINVNVYTFDEVCEIGKQNPVEYQTFDPESTHFVCYSSGTTGNPKGVIISHRACVSNTLAAADMIKVYKDTVHLSYLPLAHVFERAAVAITSMVGGSIGFISGNVSHLTEDMAILKPTHLAAVPRVMNRFYEGVMANLNKSNIIKRGLFWGCWYAKRFCLNHNLPTLPFDVLAFNRINNMMGGRIEQFVVGAAAMDPNIHEFLQVATGLPLRTGYGLTEAGSGNICNPFDIHFCYPGTVGGPLKNVEIRLEPITDYDDPDCGEILVGGQCLSSGYLYDTESTKALFYNDDHSFIRTGDVGKWDERGYLHVVDRMRSIFKLSQGEYIAAEFVTQVYEEAPLVNQIFVYGDSSRTCLVAVVVPKIKEVTKFVNKNTITNEEFAEICKRKDLNELLMNQLKECAVNHHLFGYQFIKAVYIDNEEWTVDNELITPTFKLRRKKISDRYKNEIEHLYLELDNKK